MKTALQDAKYHLLEAWKYTQAWETSTEDFTGEDEHSIMYALIREALMEVNIYMDTLETF